MLALVLLAAAAAGAGSVAAGPILPTPHEMTPSGVDSVKIGARYSTLRAAHELGKVEHGCELAGSRARGAKLLATLEGSVTLTDTSPRRVATISVTGGATAGSVRIRSTTKALRRAFPTAVFDHSIDGVFAITLVKMRMRGGGRLQLAVSTSTMMVTEIGGPSIRFCD